MSHDPAISGADSAEWGIGRVLIVDQYPPHAELLRTILASLSCHLTIVRTPDDALLAAADTRVDLALIDMGFSGAVELITAMKELTGAAIIVVSGHSPTIPVAEALDAGADDYVIAPVRPAELRARTRAVTRRHPHHCQPNSRCEAC
ncbi:MAG: response regulator [Dehalococcoidia bacterium]